MIYTGAPLVFRVRPIGDGDLAKRYAEETLPRGSLVAAKYVGRALIARSGSEPGEIYSPTNVLTSARGNLSARSGGERRAGNGRVGRGGGILSLVNPGDDVLSY